MYGLASIKPWSLADSQVVASSLKLNLRRDLQWVAKWTRRFPYQYMQVTKKHFKATYHVFIGYWVVLTTNGCHSACADLSWLPNGEKLASTCVQI